MTLLPNLSLVKTSPSFNPLEITCQPTDNISTARMAVVGDYPTTIECKEDEPFVGPAGSQLNRIFAAVNIPRYTLYLTLACKTHVSNPDKLWTDKGFKHKDWSLLQDNLITELSEFKGKLIIICGEFPMRLLIDEPKFHSIENIRGSVFKAEDFPHLAERLAGKYIAFTYHPSITLARNKPVCFYTMIGDIKKFKELDDDYSLLENKVKLFTKPTFQEVLYWFAECKTAKEVGFDIEATPQYLTCFSLAFEKETYLHTMSIPLMNNSGNYWTVEEEIIIWQELALLLSSDVSVICQNGMFDLMYLLRTMSIKTNHFGFDTMIAQHIVYTDLPKSLAYLTSAYTYYPYYKDEGKLSHLAAIKDWPMYWEYNAKDSAYLLPIKAKLLDELESFGAMKDMSYSMELHKPLMEMEYNGILTERVGIAKMKKTYLKRINAMQHGLNKLAGRDLNINSSKQLINYFYDTLGIKPYVQRAGKGKGNRTCGAIALARIAKKNTKGSAEARLIMKMRKYFKMCSTYFNINVDADNKLRCAYKVAGAKTGRLASEHTFFGTGANLQNQPPVYKKFLIADPGWILCECDLKQAEAHIVAYDSQDATMIHAFESGTDVHTFNASKIFNVHMEEVVKEQRQMGKKVVHARNYSMGPQTFSDNLAKEDIFYSQSKCKQLLDAYSARFPMLQKWHDSIKLEVSQSRVLYNLFGRPKRFLGLLDDNVFREAYAYKPQSTVGELLNRGLIKIYNDPDLGPFMFDIKLGVTVHDSVVFQFREEFLEDLYSIIKRVECHLSHQFTIKGRSFTVGMDAKIGTAWKGNTAEIKTITQENVDNAIKQIGYTL